MNKAPDSTYDSSRYTSSIQDVLDIKRTLNKKGLQFARELHQIISYIYHSISRLLTKYLSLKAEYCLIPLEANNLTLKSSLRLLGSLVEVITIRLEYRP